MDADVSATLLSKSTLAVASGSHAWLLLGIWIPLLWGDYHSTRRFVIMDVNMAAALLAALVCLKSASGTRALMFTASTLTCILWYLEAAINSAV